MYNVSGFSNRPIIAWHFLTDSDWEEAEESYLSILESGYLTAAAYRENPLLEELDRLAGDDQFLFLSLYPNVTSVYFPERGLEQFPPKVWGFGFDALELVYDYDAGELKILHYDLYRLKNYKDIAQLGIFDTSEDHIKIVEWPELIKVKPKNRIDIRFQYLKSINSRKVEIIGFGKFKEYEFFKI